MTGEPRCPLGPAREASTRGGAPADSGSSWDALWWQELNYTPSKPPDSGAEGERVRAVLSPQLPAPSPLPGPR